MKYNKILLKLSGEALMGPDSFGYNKETVHKITEEIVNLHKTGVKVAIVVGGGNICRGKQIVSHGLDGASADYMGMLATIMNGIYLQDILKLKGVDNRVMTAIHINQVCEPFIRLRAIHHLDTNKIVILTAGTGNPFATTDTAAAQRAKELNCDLIIKATKVDGIYNKDPKKYKDAKKMDHLSYKEAIEKRLEIMDATAFTMCQDFNLPIVVCDILGQNNLVKIALGEKIGSLVSN